MSADELNQWDEDEEIGCVDLEERLEAALDRAFGPKPKSSPPTSSGEHTK